MKISLAIPIYNNSKFIKETLEYPILEDRIDEIIICDDNSSDLDHLKEILQELNCSKIKLFVNHENTGVYLNKLNSLKYCTNDWAILFDSDNILNKDYLDVIYEEEWKENKIISPSLAEKINDISESLNSSFDYRSLSGEIDFSNFFEKRSTNQTSFDTLLNTCNYFVPVSTFLVIMEKNKINYDTHKIASLDSLTFFTDWIAAGNKIDVLTSLKYKHRIHQDSTYIKTLHRLNQLEWTNSQFEKIKNKIKENDNS
jgi:glycosyltransferase involved in cell wall biosynthesis